MGRRRADVAMAEMLAGGFDAERGGHERAAFLSQGVDRLLLLHALALEPRMEVAPGAIGPVVVVHRRRIGVAAGEDEFRFAALRE